MANRRDKGDFCLAEGVYRNCSVVAGPIDVQGIVYYDINVEVSASDDEHLEAIEKVAVQPVQTVGDYGLQRPVCIVARRAREDFSSPPAVGQFHIPVT